MPNQNQTPHKGRYRSDCRPTPQLIKPPRRPVCLGCRYKNTAAGAPTAGRNYFHAQLECAVINIERAQAAVKHDKFSARICSLVSQPSFGAQACGAQKIFKFQNKIINFKIPRRRNSAPKLNFKIYDARAQGPQGHAGYCALRAAFS